MCCAVLCCAVSILPGKMLCARDSWHANNTAREASFSPAGVSGGLRCVWVCLLGSQSRPDEVPVPVVGWGAGVGIQVRGMGQNKVLHRG
jgi:hypothetical protein